MKKKIMGLGVSAALAMSMCPVGMALADITGADETPQTATVNAQHIESTSYEVTIPSSTISLDTANTVAVTKCVIEKGKKLVVTIPTSLDLMVGNDVSTKITAASSDAANIEVAAGTADLSTAKQTFTYAKPSNIAYAGTYAGTVTFKAEVATV